MGPADARRPRAGRPRPRQHPAVGRTGTPPVFSSPFEALEVGDRFTSRAAGPSRRPTSSASPSSRATSTPSTPTPCGRPQAPFGERIAHGMLVLSYAAGPRPARPRARARAAPRARRRLQAARAAGRHDHASRARVADVDRSTTGVVTCAWLIRQPSDGPARRARDGRAAVAPRRRARTRAARPPSPPPARRRLTPACRCDARRQASSSSRASSRATRSPTTPPSRRTSQGRRSC